MVLVARLLAASVARAARKCGPLRKFELFRLYVHAVVPAAVIQGPLSNRTSIFDTATLSVAVPEIVRFPAAIAPSVGERMAIVGGTLSSTLEAAVLKRIS